MQEQLAAPVTKYLEKLELCVKQKVGVVPEEAICDAREHLVKDTAALRVSDPNIADDDLFEHFLESYGQPDTVAQQYEDAAGPRPVRKGNAPGWRIYCSHCGRSAPASKVGIVRIGARSKHKMILGACQDCGRTRWMRLDRDLEKTNLTRTLGASTTAAELRESKPSPLKILVAIAAIVVLSTVVVALVTKNLGH